MIASVLASALLTLATGFAPSWPALLALRAAAGISIAGLPAVAMAYVAEEIAPGPDIATDSDLEASIRAMLVQMAAPGQTIYQAWVNYAIMSAPSVQSFDLESQDFVMLSVGNMAVLGTIYFLPPGGVFVQSGAPPGTPPPPSIGSS